MKNRDEHAVVCRRIEKWFGAGEARVHALRGVDLEIRMGELAMLVGPSGCGKTTLLSVIAGLLDSNGGDLEVLGETPARMGKQERILFRRRNLGFVFQQYNLLPSLTAAENVAVPLLAAGMNRNEAAGEATRLLAQLGMGERASSLPVQLSGGQQQRVALARALVHKPRLIVCDEPTAALDAKTGHTVMELLAKVAVSPDRAVIVVTHDSRVFEFADTIAHMDDGRIETVEPGAGHARQFAAQVAQAAEAYA
ncbi:MAG: ABC transporter ATP-binding protein [Acidobacteria bacterium]|nr:MAG: ABC transporter ATP-binding protein [Acidobacteriota bacterium]